MPLLMMVRFDDRSAAETAVERLREAEADHRVELDDVALVSRSESGKVHVEQTRDKTTGRGAVRGALLGGALGVVTGGVATVAAAGAAGGAALAHKDKGISDKVMKQIGSALDGSEVVVFVAAEHEAIDTIKAHLDERHWPKADLMVLTQAEADELRTEMG